jgi:hypothetical protein
MWLILRVAHAGECRYHCAWSAVHTRGCNVCSILQESFRHPTSWAEDTNLKPRIQLEPFRFLNRVHLDSVTLILLIANFLKETAIFPVWTFQAGNVERVIKIRVKKPDNAMLQKIRLANDTVSIRINTYPIFQLLFNNFYPLLFYIN